MLRNKKWVIGVLAALISLQPKAQALPLLAENAGIRLSETLTLYPDSDDKNVYYFVPNSSVMARDSSQLPQFGFTYWGLSTGAPLKDAGAYLTFSMRLKSDEAQRRALDSVIAEGKRVAVVPVQASTIGLQTNSGERPLGKLFEEFNFAQHAGRAEDEVGVNAVMTGVGAKVFLSAIDNPQLIKLDYCYKVTGLGPNFRARIHARWDRVYDFFQASYSVGGWFFKKNIQVEVEKLMQNNLVEIFIDGGDATKEEYVRKLTELILARLFVPELKASPGSSESGGGWSFSRFSLKAVHREELKEETWILSQRDLIDREFCSNMAIKDIALYRNQLVRDADRN